MSYLSSVIFTTPPRRWLPFLTAVLLLHLTLINWALSPFPTITLRQPALPVVEADLHLAPMQLATPTPATTKPAAPPGKPIPKRSIVEPEADTDDSPSPTAREKVKIDPAGKADNSVASSKPAPPPVALTPADASKQPVSLGPLPQYSVNPPPSAELLYKAHSLHKGQDYYGKGRIRWQSNGNAFNIKGEFSVLFVNLLNFTSEGTVDPMHGVTPTVYAEKRRFRSEINTHFHRERNTISFSASPLMYQRQGGEQDRASIVWQLVGIGRNSGSKFAPGATLDIAVAGVRSAEAWKIRIVGMEEIETGLGKVRAWRLSRSARKGTYEQSLDVWLAPQHEWYPVKLRYTNANGDFLDLSLSEIDKAL